MTIINAFLAHSFRKDDETLISNFKDKFKKIKDNIASTKNFMWESAQQVEINSVSEKVRNKMENKNLFIGILTKAHQTFKASEISEDDKSKEKNIELPSDSVFWHGSSWIIQESGYAIAKEMKILFFIEEDIPFNSIGGLHGDIEHIPFNRNNIDKPCEDFEKALLTSNLKEINIPTPSPENIVPPTLLDDDIPIENWGKEKYKLKTIEAIYCGNIEEEKSITSHFLNSNHIESESDKINWKRNICGHGLSSSPKSTKNHYFKMLMGIDKSHPNDTKTMALLSQEYAKREMYDEALELINKSLNLSTDQNEIISIKICKSITLANSKRYNQAIDTLKEIISEYPETIKDKNMLARILAARAEVEFSENNYQSFTIFAEASLKLNHDNESFRFKLARKYSDLSMHSLALSHSKILAEENHTSGNLNNLGVDYNNLFLHYKSIENYRKAEVQNDIISMTNLAHCLLNEGFTDDASEICKRASEICDDSSDDVDSTDTRSYIGDVYNRIKNIKDKENKKEKEILEDASRIRNFYISYAKSTYEELPSDFPLIWKEQDCLLELNINEDNYFNLTGEIPTTSFGSGLVGALGIMGLADAEKNNEKIFIKYKGYLEGSSGKFTKETTDSFSDRRSLEEGLIIFDNSNNQIKLLSKNSSNVVSLKPPED